MSGINQTKADFVDYVSYTWWITTESKMSCNKQITVVANATLKYLENKYWVDWVKIVWITQSDENAKKNRIAVYWTYSEKDKTIWIDCSTLNKRYYKTNEIATLEETVNIISWQFYHLLSYELKNKYSESLSKKDRAWNDLILASLNYRYDSQEWYVSRAAYLREVLPFYINDNSNPIYWTDSEEVQADLFALYIKNTDFWKKLNKVLIKAFKYEANFDYMQDWNKKIFDELFLKDYVLK